MVKLIELLLKRRDNEQAKDAVTLEPKWYAAGLPALTSGYTDTRLSAYRQNLSHLEVIHAKRGKPVNFFRKEVGSRKAS